MSNDIDKTEEERDVFVSSTGQKVEILPVSPLLLQRIQSSLEKEWPQPEKPTYSEELASGDVQIFEHTEESLETEEEKAAWEAWEKESEEWQEELNRRTMRVLFYKGTDLPISDNGWVEEHELLGLHVPDDKIDRKVHYIETEIIGSVNDLMELMMLIMKSTGVDQEAFEAAEDMFRRAMERETHNAAEAAAATLDVPE